jgi:alpha-N-arabinofuranosidase
MMDGISLHHYTLPTGRWTGSKGSSTNFQENQWASTMVNSWRMDELVRKHGEVMDRSDPQKRIGLVIDEWGTWYDVEPGTNPGFLYQQNTVRDAVVAGMNLNIFNNHADRVSMANLAQTINVLQAVILTDKEKMVLTPTYHVFEMLKVHQGASLLPSEVTTPEYKYDTAAVPALNVSSSRDASGKIHVSLVNTDPNRPAKVNMKLSGAAAASITGRVITGSAMNAMNTFEKPDEVRPAPFTAIAKNGDAAELSLPARSVVILEIQ